MAISKNRCYYLLGEPFGARLTDYGRFRAMLVSSENVTLNGKRICHPFVLFIYRPIDARDGPEMVFGKLPLTLLSLPGQTRLLSPGS